MKNKYKYFLILLLLMGLVPSNKTWALSGSGTLADPYLITSCAELQSMNNNLSAHYKLANAIDCFDSMNWNSGKGFKPIGTPSTPFTGSLDGDFHPVMNLVIERTAEDYVGLFGYVDSPHFIKNISVEGEVHGRNYTGSLAGFAKTDLTHVYAFTNLFGNNFTGGVAGSFEGNAYYLMAQTSSISYDNSGKMFGEFKSGLISDVQVPLLQFDGNSNIGGIIGIMRSGTLKNALVSSAIINPDGTPAPATIHGTSQVGALVGKKEGGTVLNSYWDADYIIPNSSDGGTGLTHAETQNPSSYTGWDFTDVWIESHAVDPSGDNVPILRGYLYLLGMLPDPPPSVPAAPPAAPSGLTSTQRTTTSVTLTWDAVPSATNYIIKRDGVQVGSGSGTSFTDSGLTKTTAYLYEVIAQNADGDSLPASLNVTTLTDDWVMVSAGGDHAIGLKNNGTVWAWGYNWNGQLGNGSTSNASLPVQVRGIGGSGFLTNVKSVSAGAGSSYALLENGTVVSWGGNSSGRLGDGTTSNRLSPVKVKNTAGTSDLSNIKKIKAGSDFVLALTSTGEVYAWGANNDGQLGINSTETYKSLPVRVKDESGSSDLSVIKDITASEDSAYAIKQDGTVLSWGYNSNLKLGYAPINGVQQYPKVVPSVDNVERISSGYRHVAATKTDGSVVVWGNNQDGQFGDGTTNFSVLPFQNSNMSPSSMISTGSDQTFLIRPDGTLWGSGAGIYGSLGNNSTNDSSTFTRVLNPDGTNTLNDVVFVDSSSKFSKFTFFIRSDGTLWGFGYNRYGRLGDGTAIDRSLPVKVGEMAPPSFASSTFTANNITTNSIRLNWASNAAATNYILKRNGVQIYSGTSLSFTDSGLNPDTTYTYELIARNAGGDSPPSSLNAKTLILRIWNIIAPNPTLNFGIVTLDGSIQNMTANLGVLKVSHQGANPDGWRVTVSATPFSQVSGSLTLPANSLRLNGIQTIVQTAGSSLLPAAIAGNTPIDNGAVEILSASAGRGEGDFDVHFPPDALELNIDTNLPLADPAQNPTVYRSTITWIMSVGP